MYDVKIIDLDLKNQKNYLLERRNMTTRFD